MKSVDRALVERLLEDETLAYREIARQAGCSDWSVRSIARELAGDDRPMKREAYDGNDDGAPAPSWPVLAGFAAILAGVVWFALRGGPPPPEYGPMR